MPSAASPPRSGLAVGALTEVTFAGEELQESSAGMSVNRPADLVGATSAPVEHEIERGAIRRFADAVGDDNPVHRDVEAARSRGYADLLAPPTFAVTLTTPPLLDIDPKHILLGSREFSFMRPLVAGDVVTCQSVITDVYERIGQSGKLTFVVTDTEGKSATDDDELFMLRTITIIRRQDDG